MRNRVAMVFMLVLFPWLALSVACSTAPDHEATDDTRPADSSANDGLAGTSWRLVRILMMDDRVYTPDAVSYTHLDVYKRQALGNTMFSVSNSPL